MQVRHADRDVQLLIQHLPDLVAALALLAVLVVVFGPIVLAGVLKLMRQDMGPIIEGCGWAVNKSMRLTRKLRRQFTVTKAYPEEAEGTPARRRAAILGIVAAVVVAAVCIRAVVARGTAAPDPAAEAAAEAVEEPAADAAAE